MFRYAQRLFACLSVFSIACFIITGCGGSGPSTTSGTITGQAAKGPCAGSTATLHTVDGQGILSAPIATDTTDENGNYTLPIPAANANDSLAVKISGGTYNDEATGVLLTLSQDLTGFLQSLESDGESTLQINPVTTLAFARVKDLIDEAAAENRVITIEEAFTNAELQVRQALGIPDSIDIFKDVPGDLSAGEVTDPVAREYGAILAGFSQLGENAGVTPDQIIKALIEDFRDGDLDGKNGNDDVEIDGGGDLSDIFDGDDFDDAVRVFLESDDNQSGADLDDFEDLFDDLEGADGTAGTPPFILDVDPDQGNEVGGTVVQITGEDFLAGAKVRFGTASATNVQVNQTGTLITATTPAGTGTVDVTVENPDGFVSILEDGFTYVGAPDVDVDQLVADGRRALLDQDVPLAQTLLSQAIAADPTNQEARLFRGFTNLASLTQGSLNGQTLPPALEGFLEDFGFTVNSLDIYSQGDVLFDVQEPTDNDGNLVLADDSPTGEEVTDFIIQEVLPALCAAIEDLDAIDQTFTPLLLSAADFGFEEEDDDGLLGGNGPDEPNEVDFGDVALLKSCLLLNKAQLLILVSNDIETDIDEAIDDANADTLILENSLIGFTFTEDDPAGILGGNPDFLTLDTQAQVTGNTLEDARQALLDAAASYFAASAFIRAETDDQSDDLIVFPDPDDPLDIQQEDQDLEADFRDLLAAYEESVSGTGNQVPVDIGATETFTLNLDTFFDGLDIQDFLPTFHHFGGDNFADLASLTADPTFGGIAPGLTLENLSEALGKFSDQTFKVDLTNNQVSDGNAASGPPDQTAVLINTNEGVVAPFNDGNFILGVPGQNDVRIHVSGTGLFTVLAEIRNAGSAIIDLGTQKVTDGSGIAHDIVDFGPTGSPLIGLGQFDADNGDVDANVPDGLIAESIVVAADEDDVQVDAVEALHWGDEIGDLLGDLFEEFDEGPGGQQGNFGP